MKKIWFILIAVLIVAIAWYTISPIFKVIEKNEASPLGEDLVVKDAMDSMSPKTKEQFEREVEAMKDKTILMKDDMTNSVRKIAEGFFKPRAHDVIGKALVIEKDGKKILRFENFDTINGPVLHIYLASELSNDDVIDLGKIKATKGNVNYDIPENVDLSKYNKVLVWCKTFSVLFSYSVLS